jgi:hypothetical protein
VISLSAIYARESETKQSSRTNGIKPSQRPYSESYSLAEGLLISIAVFAFRTNSWGQTPTQPESTSIAALSNEQQPKFGAVRFHREEPLEDEFTYLHAGGWLIQRAQKFK